MRLPEINALLRVAKLPSIDATQLEMLAAAGEGASFEDALLRLEEGEAAAAGYLELIVRSVSPWIAPCLEELGVRCSLQTFIDTAKREQRPLFAALHSVRANKPQRVEAIAYLRSLGLGAIRAPTVRPSAQPARPDRIEQHAIPPYYSFKIFGQSAALCISEANTRTGNLHTVQIEGAGVLAGSSKQFDWPNKITVQLTTQEAYQLLALLENHVESVKFEGHGRQHDKALYVEYQGATFFVRLIQRGHPALALPVRPVDAMPIIALLYKQILLNEPHLNIDNIQRMLVRMAKMMAEPGHKPSPR